MKNIRFFYLKIFIFLVVKFSIYLNRRVFVMKYLGVDVKSSLTWNTLIDRITGNAN